MTSERTATSLGTSDLKLFSGDAREFLHQLSRRCISEECGGVARNLSILAPANHYLNKILFSLKVDIGHAVGEEIHNRD
jgi:hypothetical protein